MPSDQTNPSEIQRWAFWGSADDAGMRPNNIGQWVKHSDHLAAVAERDEAVKALAKLIATTDAGDENHGGGWSDDGVLEAWRAARDAVGANPIARAAVDAAKGGTK